MGLNKPNNEIDTSTLAQESTSQEIKLSNESIKAVADEILSRIGATTDSGGANTGTVLGKLNALFSSGGGISGFKYTQKTGSFTYTPQSSGIVIGRCYGRFSSSNPEITITNGSVIDIFNANASSSYQIDFNFLGFFATNATIKGNPDGEYISCNIFEFI